jgi:2-polyprenyl-6-methoxyphenol hydroxylase-like FAD-dependent oxidoreductase
MAIVIAGGGIGGLSAALSLHAAGRTDIVVLEAAREIRQLGVGVNLPPHAVRELTELGLGEELARIGIPTAELSYYDTRGKLIWAEERGLTAGYLWPQYSVHRGKLQQLLLDTVCQRLGADAIRTGQRVSALHVEADGIVHVDAIDSRSGAVSRHAAGLLIGADGIRSAVRGLLYGAQAPLAWNGWMMYRGTTRAAPFLTGKSMVIIGDEHLRVVVYPIEPGVINWLLVRPKSGAADEAGELGNWNREVSPQAIAGFVRDWRFDWLDVPALVGASDIAYEYPMVDIEPLPRWVFGNAILLGDSAHAMYPFGSNGASQAIIDARVLAYELAMHGNQADALQAYQAKRLPIASGVQLANRRQAGDVMAKISELARQSAHGSAAAELKEVELGYKRLAGFDAETLNTRPSWSVTK